MRALLALFGLLLGAAVPRALGDASIHTVITTECSPYFSWQTLGMFYSHKRAGQPGPITRIMCCTPEEYERLPEADRDLVPTHVAPSFTHHPRLGDVYSAYNKPLAIIDWLAKNEVKEEYVLVIDADMIMRTPFTAEDVGAKPGLACAAYFGYMKGVKNQLAMKHVPYVKPRNDTIAGPRGRRGDQVGGFTLMHREDLRRVAPHWLKFTEAVRFDPDAWELTGDAYSTHKGDRPWISEMYGYSYGCATADVWHTVHHTAMLYPGYEVAEPPHVLHYGLLWHVPGTDYSFDKHWHYQFDPLSCPPWQIGTNPRESHKGLFAHPPHPRSFKTSGAALLRDLMSIEAIITLNAAFCERFRRVCPPSEELERECGKAEQLMRDYDEAYRELEAALPDPCRDTDERCPRWAAAGECEKNQGFMFDSCMLSCKRCQLRRKAAEGAKAIAADAVGAAARAREQQQQQAADGGALQHTKGAVQDSITLRGGGAAHDAAVLAAAKELRKKCTGHPDWTMDQVKECLRLAAKGEKYEPKAVAGAVGGQQRAAGGAGAKAAAQGGNEEEEQGAGAGGERGQRQEQQLHEDEEVLRQGLEGEDAAGEATAGQAGAATDALLDEGRLLGQRINGEGGRAAGVRLGETQGTVKRLDEGDDDGSLGASRLGLFGVLLWAATLAVAFFLLPWARRAVRRSGGLLPTGAAPYRGKGRDD
ncbi:hypothetical protein ABPG75_011669 [Micractinium tetrahymenae]